MRRGDGHLQTHLADNQISVRARYITDKLFIKQRGRVAAVGPLVGRWRMSELKGRRVKIRGKGPRHIQGTAIALSK